jgi:hypothetical protein
MRSDVYYNRNINTICYSTGQCYVLVNYKCLFLNGKLRNDRNLEFMKKFENPVLFIWNTRSTKSTTDDALLLYLKNEYRGAFVYMTCTEPFSPPETEFLSLFDSGKKIYIYSEKMDLRDRMTYHNIHNIGNECEMLWMREKDEYEICDCESEDFQPLEYFENCTNISASDYDAYRTKEKEIILLVGPPVFDRIVFKNILKQHWKYLSADPNKIHEINELYHKHEKSIIIEVNNTEFATLDKITVPHRIFYLNEHEFNTETQVKLFSHISLACQKHDGAKRYDISGIIDFFKYKYFPENSPVVRIQYKAFGIHAKNSLKNYLHTYHYCDKLALTMLNQF